jgi:hypothetical protein
VSQDAHALGAALPDERGGAKLVQQAPPPVPERLQVRQATGPLPPLAPMAGHTLVDDVR